MWMLVVFLEQKEVVGSCDSDDVLLWMPGSVKNLLVEVEAVDGDFVLFPLSTGAHLHIWVGIGTLIKKYFLFLRK